MNTLEILYLYPDILELYGDYGGSIIYFFGGLGSGDVDYTSYGIQKGLGNITPLNKEEFYLLVKLLHIFC